MPQDELWRASARLTGWNIKCELEPSWDGNDALFISPTWSQNPSSGNTGFVHLNVPVYARDYIPRLIRAAHFELTGGLAKNVPAVLRYELKGVLQDFEQGVVQ